MSTSCTGTKGKVIGIRKNIKPPTKRDSVATHILKSWEPSEKERYAVRIMVAGGMKQDDIAKCIHPQGPISVSTLKRKFPEEISHGRADITKQVISVLTEMALNGRNPGATMFWLKTQAGWKETNGLGSSIGNSKFGTNLSATEEITKKLQNTAKFAAETLPRCKTGTGD